MAGGTTLLLALVWTMAGLTAEGPQDRQLGGVWVLDTVQDGARTSHDPRWTFMMTFEGDHRFSVASRTVIEKHAVGAEGASVQAIQQDIRFLGTYRFVGDRLQLTPRPPLVGEALAFARVNFDAAPRGGSYSPRWSLDAGLALANPATERRLQFRRHERRAPS